MLYSFVDRSFTFPGSREAELIQVIFIYQGTSMLLTIRQVDTRTLCCEWSWGPRNLQLPLDHSPLHSLCSSHTALAPPTCTTLVPLQDLYVRHGSLFLGFTSPHALTLSSSHIRPPRAVSSWEGLVLGTLLQAGLPSVFSVSASRLLPSAYLGKYVSISFISNSLLFITTIAGQ